jgi:hypothetical protein
MEKIKPKKERKFLKAIGDVALTLVRDLLLNVGKKVINKVGNKRQGLAIVFLLVAGISYASIDSIPYPLTGNKQRLGWQTSGNGLVYRGRSNDTITKPSSYVDKNVKAYLLLDSVRGTIFVWRQTYWDSILVGSGAFTQPIDSLFFDTSVPTNNVETAKMRWDSDLGTVALGMYDQVPNELGFKNFWLVKNQTGSTITKNSIVYASGTVGASGRITVDKFIANGSIDAKYLLGITAHDLTDGEDGYVISFGKIRQVNTDTFAAGAILYPSPTVAGVWTDIEPVAPNIDMPIGFCVNSSSNNGTIAIRVASGYKLSELHDVAISSPVEKSSLYYSGGLWRDTTAALLVSDTAFMLSNYATKAYADTTGRLYARQDFTNVSSSTLTWTQSDTLIPGGVNVVQVYRNGQILLPSQYTIPTSTSVVIAVSSFKVNDNYTVIFPRGGGAGSGGGSGSLTSISGGTGIIVSPNPITTTGTVSADLSVLMELTDTSLLNLSTRFASKLNTTDTVSLSNRIDAKGTGTVTSVATGYGLTGGTITSTGTLVLDSAVVFSRIRDSIVDVAIGNDTIKILKQEYAPATTSVLTWTVTPKFPIQLKQYILVFRNGQLLINDQYNLTDTNKITIVTNSFKVGANYTVVTVSGIGSVGTGVFQNPIYPEAGIALSTGSTWASSIPNNSSNWNTAFTDRLKWDGGSTGLTPSTGRTSLGGTTIGQSMFTLTNPSTISFPRFNADNTVTALSAASFRSAIGAGTVTSVNVAAGTPMSIINNTTTPEISMLAATGSVNGYLTSTDWTTFNNKQNALGFTPANSTITINTTSPLQGGGNLSANRTLSILSASDVQSGIVSTTAQLFSGSKVFKHRLTADSLFYLNNTSPIPTAILGIDLTGGVNSVGKFTLGNGLSITSSTLLADTNLLVTRFDTSSMLTPYFRDADTSQLNLTSRFSAKLNYTDTSFLFTQSDTSQLNLTSRFAAKLNLSDTLNMLVPYLRKADTTLMLSKYLRRADTSLLNLTSRFAAKLNISDTASMLTPYFRDADTSQLNLTSRFSAKQNTLSGTGFIKASGTSITYDNSSYLTTSSAASTYLPLTGGTLTGDLYAKYLNTFAKTTYIPFDVGIGENLTNISSAFRGGTIMVFPDSNLIGSSANVFLANKLFAGEYSTFGSGMRNYAHQGGDTRNNSLAFYTSGIGSQNTNRLYINFNGDIGINDDTPSYKLDINGTLNATGAATLGSTLAVSGDITENGNNVLTSADTTSMLLPYLRKADTTNMLLPYFRDADTTSLNLTSRFAAKLNLSDTIKLTTFGTSNAATLINKTLNIPNYKTLSVTDPLQDYLVKFSDNIGAGIKRSNIFEDGTTVDMASSDVKLGAIKNNGTFSSPITISTNCGSSGSPNLIGTSTGNYVNNCSSGTAYILLPDPADVSGFTVGRILTITNLRSDQSIVLNTSGSYSNARPLGIDGAAESSIAAKRWITVQSNGTNWYIISTGSAL